jgi:hypothetical protein
MKKKMIIICSLLAGTMHSAWGMDPAQDKMTRAKRLLRGKFWKCSAEEQKKSDEELEKCIEAKAEEGCARQPSLKTLERLYLEGEGFCGPLPEPAQSYNDFWAGKRDVVNHNGD